MPSETISAVTTIDAPAEAVFAVLADPTSHPAIDGTGWVDEPLDEAVLTEAGQIFRMAMYHSAHPDRNYEMANRVRTFDPPRTISWEPGRYAAGGDMEIGGWIWRYDLAPAGESTTEVTLTYDWSAVPEQARAEVPFPPFAAGHLDNSLNHLAGIVVSGNTGTDAR